MQNNIISDFIKPKLGFYKKKFNWKKLLIITGVILGIFVIFFGTLFFIYHTPIKKVYSEGLSGKNQFLDAQELLLSQDFSAAQTALDGAVNHFSAAKEEFKKITWLESIPLLGTQIKAIDNLLSAGVTTGESLKEVAFTASIIVQPITKKPDVSLATLTPEETHQLLKNIYEAKPKLENAKKTIDEAVAFIDEIPDKGLIKQIQDAVQPLKEKVPQLQKGLDQAVSASQIIPAVAGYPENKTYLFLLQNNTELRPTGGFIGTYGILRVKDGDIKTFTTDNIYNLDKPAESWLNETPPVQLTRYNAVYKWFMRDSNWSPDFPTSAQKAEWFYRAEKGPEKNFDGIVAVTPSFIQSLLTLTGEMKVNGLTFTSENFIEKLQYQVDQGFLRQDLPESERKEIIGVLSTEILDSVLALPKNRWPDLWKVFQKDIEQKQVLIYLKDAYVQSYIIKENWGGEIRDVDYDYLTVIDANLASLKSDPGVKRSVDYQIRRDGDNIIADLTIKYRNEGSITWKTTRYRTYVRIYVPQGATLLKSEGAMIDCKIEKEGSIDTSEELNKTVFGTFMCIEPGEEKILHIKYKLPTRITEQFKKNTYTLLVQKQPGSQIIPLNLNLNLSSSIYTVFGLDNFQLSDNNKLLFTTDISQDRTIELEFK